MARQPHNRPPFAPQTRAVKPKLPAQPQVDEKTAARLAKLDPLTLTENVFVRARPEKVYYALNQPLERPRWDKHMTRVRFVAASKGAAVPSKVAENALVETIFPLRLGGLFQMQYVMVQQGRGFALQAVKGSFGVLGGLAEAWAVESFKGGTQVTLRRTLIPRFKPLKNYVERNHSKAMKEALEGLKRFVEDAQK